MRSHLAWVSQKLRSVNCTFAGTLVQHPVSFKWLMVDSIADYTGGLPRIACLHPFDAQMQSPARYARILIPL